MKTTDGNLVADARAMNQELVALRRAVHRRPEVGIDLPMTQRTVLEALEPLALRTSLGRQLSSVVSILEGARPGPTVILRAEMDALPIHERSGETFSSETAGVMHACGHDLHLAALVGAARLLTARRDGLQGNVMFMFEPGEEGRHGARRMLEEGLLDLAPTPIVGAYAVHSTSGGAMVERGKFASRSGTVMAGMDSFRVVMRGRGGHAATPHLALDVIPAAAALVGSLQVMVTRRIDALDPAVLTVSTINGGVQHNVISDEVALEGTLRTFTSGTRAKAMDLFEVQCAGIAAAHGVSVTTTWEEGYPATVNGAAHTGRAKAVVQALLGLDRWSELDQPIAGSEDFSYVLEQVGGAFLVFGAVPADVELGDAGFNHSAVARFDDGFVADAAVVLAGLALSALDPGSADSFTP